MADFDSGAMLRGFWYIACLSRTVPAGTTRAATLVGEALLLGRSAAGAPFAYADRCPHRGMPMRHGTFDGTSLRCCYHGWAFSAANGACTEIPALAEADGRDTSRLRLRAYPCQDVQGNLWVFMPDGPLPDPLPPVPQVPGFAGAAPQVSATMRFPSNADIAAFGFCDPAHPAFVHTSRWWKSRSGLRLRPKQKSFEPTAMGFRMAQHPLKHGANPYRLLGGNVRVDISVSLPGLRLEHIHGDRHQAAVLASVTPVTSGETDVHYCVYWTVPWLWPVRPAAAWMARDFLRQDRDVAAKLASGARVAAKAGLQDGDSTPPMLFVGDADLQIAWLMRLKREYLSSRAERRAFHNPLAPQTLQWKS